MKIYVDKLPKSCWECPCFKRDMEQSCGLDDEYKDYFLDEIDGGECPLHTIEELQNEKAIECLEKLRDKIYNLSIGDYYLQNGGTYENIKEKRAEVYNLIDQFIAELKGGAR